MPQGLSLSALEAVLFDVDGTLVDSLDMLIKGLSDTYDRFNGNRPPDEEIRKLMGLPLREQLLHFREEAPSKELLEQMFTYALTRFKAHQHLERVLLPAVQALQLCHRAGLRTGLVTSKSSTELKPFLERFPGTPLINVSVCASDVSHPKPDPESAILACQRLGVEPAESAFVGDSSFDVRCGRRAGTKTIAVGYGCASREELLAEQPDMLVDTPEELRQWVSDQLLDSICHERN